MEIPSSGRSVSRRAVLAAGAGTAAALALPSIADAVEGSGRGRARHVVLVGWDGFDPAYLDLVETPHLDALARRGVVGTTTGCFPSITNTSWASVVSGAWPRTHLNTPYFLDPATGRAVSQSRTLEAPTIAEAVTAAGGTVASVQFFILQNHGVVFGDPRALYVQPGGTGPSRLDVAADILHGRPVQSGSTTVTVERPPTLLAVYADDLDALGHAEGAESPGMAGRLAALDAALGRLVQATKDVGTYGSTAFVLLGDHGMTTFTRAFGGDVLAALTAAGFTPEFVAPGAAPAPSTDVAMVVGGVANVYLLGAARTPDGVARARAALESVEAVERVHDRAALDAFGASPLLGELVAEPVAGWSFGLTDPDGPRGYHGRTGEREAALLVAGRGVSPRARLDGARHVDVAPTIAALLGIPAPSRGEGRVLTEALHTMPG
ncbi:alkaline phosphatase family protein [Jiangella alba]|uniref:Predicted pyrophosphatase or phosphodiesterase, AlkP superfamily n=1 Tax=Jiangella alba TaxID=561176 RepID=A0A1H5PQ81_9ACTN|nr:alkaline phosphatase family protein [Jiangella alba]SEF16063.1 Predicted pyrophosphatase or phosphodiesterase, AlkP superfamily [Jiangella alba]